MKNRDFRANAFEQRVEITAAGAVFKFDGHLELRLFERGKINELVELFEISRLRIERRALIRADDRAFEGPVLRLEVGDVRLDLFGDFRRGGRAVARGKFQTLIFRRVMAGGHVDAAGRLAMADGMGDDRRGRVAIAKERFESVGGQHFGGGQRKFAPQESCVVTQNDDFGLWTRGLLDFR